MLNMLIASGYCHDGAFKFCKKEAPLHDWEHVKNTIYGPVISAVYIRVRLPVHGHLTEVEV